jgi:cell wall-associated NlpC family hydrolase
MRNYFDQVLYDYAVSFIGLPYRWGGDDTIDGFDCSGLVLELMYSCGIVSPRVDMTAQGIYDYFYGRHALHAVAPSFGALVFFGNSTRKITHVAFCLDQYRMLEAGGGGSKTKTSEDAANQNAYVRVRPVSIRRDKVAILKPQYYSIGGL